MYKHVTRTMMGLVLVAALAACSNDEDDGGDGHSQPESVRLFEVGGDEIVAPYTLESGVTTRVEVHFYDSHGDDISDELAETGHQTALVFDPATFATEAPVTGEIFQRDVTVDAAAGTTASLSVGYGHHDPDERFFGPFEFTAVVTAATTQ